MSTAVAEPGAIERAHRALLTRWAAEVDAENVLPEYPRPQMVRPRWQSLNGTWQLACPREGAESVPTGEELPERIRVPFPVESVLSGVGRHEPHLVYRRTFTAPEMAEGERLLLHFGAVDWRARVFVNGRRLAEHTGGFDAFTVDVTEALREGEQELVVAVDDSTDGFGQPRGKQATEPHPIFYTPVTGIWQTVWLEPVPATSIQSLRMTPDVAGEALLLTVRGADGMAVEAVARAGGREVGRVRGTAGSEMRVPVPAPRLWGPDDPFLYDLRVALLDGDREVDAVDSYFGMRTVGLRRDERGFTRIALNGEPWFHVGPLDQGWWPDGLYTAPTDEALRFDLEQTKALGFGFTRKHIKVEPARWYYHADRIGLPVWQDMPCGWNDTPEARGHFASELAAMMDGLHNHPCILVWVPFNEKWGQWSDEGTRETVAAMRLADPSRLIDDASGWQHAGVGDIIDVHRYQGPQALVPSPDKATAVGEYGGLGYPVLGHLWRESDENWGYGGAYGSRAEMNARYDLLMRRMYRLRDTHGMSAAVYTQLTDVETEVNGLFSYDRAVLKVDPARLAAVNRGLAPLLLPEYGELTDEILVTVHQGTPTELRYTADGSEPTAESPLFHPFTIRDDTTVRVKSFADGHPTAAPEARMEYRRTVGRAPVEAAVVPGIEYAYFPDESPEPAFRLDWPVRSFLEDLPRNDEPEPAHSGTLPDFSLDARDREEMFGFRFTGYLRVPATGVYTFSARSDDGVGLWIGEERVMWSMGQSPATQEDEGQIALQAGLHPFTVSYHNAYGPMALELFVAGPGMPRQRIPASMLFRAQS
jgi:hypothetical protein